MRCFSAVFFVLLLCSGPALAAEGMYLLHDLPAARLKKSGLKIDPSELNRLSKAVIQVARGGTGSFVSDKGLFVTNHHVAYGCIARLGARKEHLGLLERGHVAKSAAEELPCPGYDLLVVREVRDVTREVLSVVKPRMHWSKRFEAIRLKKEELIRACEAGARGGKGRSPAARRSGATKDPARVCEVAALDGGNGYLLSVYLRVRDVRLVYAPPRDLGKFGGDVDNWIFPRHTADFTFMRAYVDRQGRGARHAADNVPLETPTHLKISPHGVRRGSLALVIGFPGRTARHVTSHAARFHLEQKVPAVKALLGGLAGVLDRRMKQSADARRKYAGLDAGLQNALKYYRMSLEGFKKWRVLERKVEEEKKLGQDLVRAQLARKKRLLRQIRGVYARYRRHHPRYAALRRLIRIGRTVGMAYAAVHWAREKHKPDRMRKEDAYKDKNIYRIKEAAERLDHEVEIATEKALLLHVLRETEKLPRGQRLRATAKLLRRTRTRKLEDAVELVYNKTRLLARSADAKERERAAAARKALFAAASAEVARSKDPLVQLARDLEAELHALKEGPHREVEQRLATVLHPEWVKEIKRPAYPDANFTVRLSFGSVRDYTASATGKKHRYITSLSGLLEKDKGAFPFRVPPALKTAYPGRLESRWVDRRIKDIPVNFTTTLDTTGGNSGSPVLDDRGRLVGLLFDGTPESILSDWQYLPDEQRSICMDIRLALYLAGVEKAARVLKELGL